MIRLSTGSDVRRLLDLACEHPENYKRVIVCSPFLDDTTNQFLVSLFLASKSAKVGVRVVTTPRPAARLCRMLPGHAANWTGTVIPIECLHMKAYVAIGRRPRLTRAIVTSANLTCAGLSKNFELGVTTTVNSVEGRRLITDLTTRLDRLTGRPRLLRVSSIQPRRAA